MNLTFQHAILFYNYYSCFKLSDAYNVSIISEILEDNNTDFLNSY